MGLTKKRPRSEPAAHAVESFRNPLLERGNEIQEKKGPTGDSHGQAQSDTIGKRNRKARQINRYVHEARRRRDVVWRRNQRRIKKLLPRACGRSKGDLRIL